MKKVGFQIAMNNFAAKKIGTYKFKGKTQDLYKWKDFVFYFDGIDKVIAVGNTSTDLGIRLYSEFNGHFNISFENGEHGECDIENVSIDPRAYKGQNIITQNYHRVYYISSVRTLLAFLLYITKYEHEPHDNTIDCLSADDREKKKMQEYIEFDEVVQSYYEKFNWAIDILLKLSLPVVKGAPFIEATGKDDSPFRNYLAIKLREFDTFVNPYQYLAILDEKFSDYMKDIDVDISYDQDKTNIELRLIDRTSSTRSSYAYTKEKIVYDAIRENSELHYTRVRHLYVAHDEEEHMSGELVIIMPVITQRVTEPTRRATIYNVSENMMCIDGVWHPATEEDIAWIANQVSTASAILNESIVSKMTPAKTYKYTPLKKEE